MAADGTLDALDQLDFVLLTVLGVILVSSVTSYVLLPHVMPTEKKKTAFRHFFFGSGLLAHYRGVNDPPFTAADLPDSPGTDSHNVEQFVGRLCREWTPKSERSLYTSLLRFMAPWWIYSHLLLGFNRLLELLAGTYVMQCILRFMQLPVHEAGHVVYKLQVFGFLHAIAWHMSELWCAEIMTTVATDQMCSGLRLMVVRKMHRLSLKGISETSSAEAQLVAQEVGHLSRALWQSPLKSFLVDIVMCIYAFVQLHSLFGTTCIMLGLGITALLWFMGSICVSAQNVHLGQMYGTILARQGVLNMLLENFKALKLYGWVERACQLLVEQRVLLRFHKFRIDLWSSLSVMFVGQVDAAIILLSFVFSSSVEGDKMSFEKAWMAQALMGILTGAFGRLVQLKSSLFNLSQHISRIEAFLRLPEQEDSLVSEGLLEVTDATFKWPGSSAEAGSFCLSNVSLQPREGELMLLCGAVGSGKSSLLMALLGEMPRVEGSATLPAGEIVYQPQLPFLLEGTIRGNVLFGIADEDCDEDHLHQAIAAAQLTGDMHSGRSNLHAGREQTNVGRRGGHLSGGQRARTALARSIYAVLQGATVVILDDPVASVDNEMVQAVWEGAVLGAMGGTTRIVVVNSQLLERLAPTADRLVVLANGRISYDGPPTGAACEDALRSWVLSGPVHLAAGVAGAEARTAVHEKHVVGVPNSRALEHADRSEVLEADRSIPQDTANPALLLADMIRDCQPLSDFVSRQPQRALTVEASKEALVAPLALPPEDWQKLRELLRDIEIWHRAPASVDNPQLSAIRVVWDFFLRMRGLVLVSGCLGMLMMIRMPVIFGTVQRWVSSGAEHRDHELWRTLVCQFVGFALLGVALRFIESTSQSLLTDSLVGESDDRLSSLGMWFFWRRQGDAELQLRKAANTDYSALWGICAMPVHALQCIAIVASMAFHAPALWLVSGLLLLISLKVNDLNRWMSAQVWPAFNDAQNSLWSRMVEQFDLLLPMRALKRQPHFERKLYGAIMSNVYYNFLRTQSEVLGGFVYHVVGSMFSVYSIILINGMKIAGKDPSEIYMFFTLCQGLRGMMHSLSMLLAPFQDLMQKYREVEVLLKADIVETESGEDPPSDWPSEGIVRVEEVTFRYMLHAPAALCGVSLETKPAEKVGIVGKTGSGKSTLLCLLLRLGPLKSEVPGTGSGRVLLDGIDLATLKRSAVRDKIGIVPQEPTVFDMSLKENIGAEYTDAEVLTVLEWCGLDARKVTHATTLTEALASKVAVSTLSIGQQQLLMAARVLVRRPKVLILDECTASLDQESADRLLDVLMTRAADATILSIAHRLRFVLRSDRILVLANGKVVAFDTPAKLLEDTDGYFAVNLQLEQQEEGGEPLTALGAEQ